MRLKLAIVATTMPNDFTPTVEQLLRARIVAATAEATAKASSKFGSKQSVLLDRLDPQEKAPTPVLGHMTETGGGAEKLVVTGMLPVDVEMSMDGEANVPSPFKALPVRTPRRSSDAQQPGLGYMIWTGQENSCTNPKKEHDSWAKRCEIDDGASTCLPRSGAGSALAFSVKIYRLFGLLCHSTPSVGGHCICVCL